MNLLKYFFAFLLLGGVSGYAQCKVKSPKLAGEYTGDCKKNLAHGEGFAQGEDSYKGEFSKGLPNGKGVYEFKNGDVFTGVFKKGLKDGEGVLKVNETGETVKGYWKSDTYIGAEKTPYKVLQKSAQVTTTMFKKKGDKDELVIKFTQKGKTLNNKKALVVPQEGTFGSVNSNGLTTTIQSVTYPFTGTVNGQLLRFRITQPGTWEITINLQ